MTERDLILHIGLPKTGSSALQSWCHRNRAMLAGYGVDYPLSAGGSTKHQFIIQALMKGDFAEVETVLRRNLSARMVMSSEGMTNHLYDFSSAALSSFRTAVAGYRVRLFMVAREERAWLRSLYAQMVVNSVEPRFHYGTPLPFDEFCRLPRIRRLADTRRLAADVRDGFGAAECRVVSYESDWMAEFLDMLAIDPQAALPPLPRENSTVPPSVVEIVRQINGFRLEPRNRVAALAAIERCFDTRNLALLQAIGQHPDDGQLRQVATGLLPRLLADGAEAGDALERLADFAGAAP